MDIATAWALVTATAVHHNMYFAAEMTVSIAPIKRECFRASTVV